MVMARPKINKINPNEVKIIEQKIVEVHNNFIKVVSRKGNTYNVNLSDIVKMTMTIENGDTAIIKTFPNGWLVTGIIKQEKPPVLTSKEEQEELERELKELEDLGWGMY